MKNTINKTASNAVDEKYEIKVTVKEELNRGAIINANHPKNIEANRFLKKFDLRNILK